VIVIAVAGRGGGIYGQNNKMGQGWAKKFRFVTGPVRWGRGGYAIPLII